MIRRTADRGRERRKAVSPSNLCGNSHKETAYETPGSHALNALARKRAGQGIILREMIEAGEGSQESSWVKRDPEGTRIMGTVQGIHIMHG